MQKELILILVLFFSIAPVLAETTCDLNVKLLSQDPYPAVPGDYVKLVFQLDGLDSPNCDDITFELLSQYPISFKAGDSKIKTFKKLDYIKDYKSEVLVPYEVILDENSIDGKTPIDVKIQSKGDAPITKTFDLEVEDVRATFEISVKKYNPTTNEMTLEVLNTGKSNIEALTLEIPKQDTIKIKGSNRVIVGDLDSNEYTSADFKSHLVDGKFKINLIYSDKINIRRTVEKEIVFDSSYFSNDESSKGKKGLTGYLLWGIIILLLAYFIYRRRKNKLQQTKSKR